MVAKTPFERGSGIPGLVIHAYDMHVYDRVLIMSPIGLAYLAHSLQWSEALIASPVKGLTNSKYFGFGICVYTQPNSCGWESISCSDIRVLRAYDVSPASGLKVWRLRHVHPSGYHERSLQVSIGTTHLFVRVCWSHKNIRRTRMRSTLPLTKVQWQPRDASPKKMAGLDTM